MRTFVGDLTAGVFCNQALVQLVVRLGWTVLLELCGSTFAILNKS